MIRRLIDVTLLKFLLVGVANTLFSAAVMFFLYRRLGFGYWGCSAVAFVLASILSFALNRRFTFRDSGALGGTAFRFGLNVAVCYLLAYSLAKPATEWCLSGTGLTPSVREQIALLFGMCLFTGLNYLGQRFFTFRSQKDSEKRRRGS